MIGKVGILFVIFALLYIFYLVISLGAGKKNKSELKPEIKNYLFNVKVLIIFIGVVAFILWLFL